MAMIRERGPFSFQVVSKVRGKSFYHGTFETREEAEVLAAQLKLDASRGKKIDRRNAKVAMRDVVQSYLDKKILVESPNDDSAISRLRRYIRAADASAEFALFMRKVLNDVDTDDINDYIASREDDDILPGTINRELNLLGSVFSWARKEYKCLDYRNPIQGCDRPPADDARDRVLTFGEALILEPHIKSSPSKFLFTAYLIAVTTAMRQGEIAKAKWLDLDESQPDYTGLNIPKVNTKTKKSRQIPLSPELMAHLRTLTRGDEFILRGATTSAIKQAWRKAVKAAGIQDLRFHDLRHTAITRLALTRRLDKIDLMKITGHSSEKMLARYFNPTAQELHKQLYER